MARKRQWHPIFAELLRPVVESHYDIETDVPVGDAPRKADFVLLRRTRAGQVPAGGLWRDLAPWNVLEFKGPTVSPRDDDLEALVELGLGIHRRLNEERAHRDRPTLGPEDVSLWYLAPHLGRRLLSSWERRAPGLRPHGAGVWRCEFLGRAVLLVSGSELPVEEASLPLHLIAREPSESERAVAQLLAGRSELWERYGGWLASLHPAAFEEVENMTKATKRRSPIDLEPLVRSMGLKQVIDQLGSKRVIQELGAQRVIKDLGVKAAIEQLGAQQVIEGLGGVDEFLAVLSPELREQLKERLQD